MRMMCRDANKVALKCWNGLWLRNYFIRCHRCQHLNTTKRLTMRGFFFFPISDKNEGRREKKFDDIWHNHEVDERREENGMVNFCIRVNWHVHYEFTLLFISFCSSFRYKRQRHWSLALYYIKVFVIISSTLCIYINVTNRNEMRERSKDWMKDDSTQCSQLLFKLQLQAKLK